MVFTRMGRSSALQKTEGQPGEVRNLRACPQDGDQELEA
jgi:hypothetical protein